MPSGVAEGFFRGTRTTTSDDRFDPRVAVELPSQDVVREMVLVDYDLCVFPPLVVPLFIAEQHERSSRLEPRVIHVGFLELDLLAWSDLHSRFFAA